MPKDIDSARLERRTLEIGADLLTAARQVEAEAKGGERWIRSFLQRSMEDERFQVQALRFVDVLPALRDDADLVRHLREYFAGGELPLPGIAKWGLAGARAGLVPGLLAKAVRNVMGTLAHRFLGGRQAGEILRTLRLLRGQGVNCSLDRLGEATLSEAEADSYLQAYLDLLESLVDEAVGWPEDPLLDTIDGRASPRVNLSVKPSSLHSQAKAQDLDGSVRGLAARLRPILSAAKASGASVCLDMEQYERKELTLGVFRLLLGEPGFADWCDAGIALQAYLRDAEQDLAELAEWASDRGAPVTVRLVRGAYWDQETVVAQYHGWPIPVWTQKWQSDACYERCLRQLFDAYPDLEAAVATHNVRSIALAMALAEERGLEPHQFEFQVLYGMGEALRSAIVSRGYRVRVYVPFGELLPGMAYLVRRLLENSSSQSFLRMGSIPEDPPEALLAAPCPTTVAEEQPVTWFPNEPVHRFTSATERDAFAAAIHRVQGDLGGYYPLVIGGREVETRTRISSVNPARPDEVVGNVATAVAEQGQAAVEAAAKAYPDWRALSPGQRADFLSRIAGLLRKRRDEFAAWEILEAGKTWPEADADVTEAIDFLEYYGAEARRLGGGLVMDSPGETNGYFYIPRGVGVVIPPWNFPLAILTGMLSATIVAGNTALLKPSSQTPVIAARFMGLLREAGLPDGVVNFVPGHGRDVGEFLVMHPGTHLVAFTGSVDVGTRINRLASDLATGQHHVKKVIAEMGGKNAIIIDSDAELDDAVLGTVRSAFGYQGQKCSACSRVIVVGSAYEAFLPRLVEAARSLAIGMPEEPGTSLGPIIEAAAKERIRAAIEDGKKVATPVLEVNASHLEPGYFVGPTIFAEVPASSRLAQEEIFGPVLAVMRASDIDDALRLANGVKYALTGGLYSRSPANIAKVRESFRVGNLYINRKITGALVGRQPFGGFKLSGVGSKAGGPDYLLQFMEPRTVTENTLRRGFTPGIDLARHLGKS